MLGHIINLFVLIVFCDLSNAKVSNFYVMESEMNDKVSNASLVGEYHSDSPIMCSGFGQFNYLAFNAKEKKCRVHTCYPAGKMLHKVGWIYYISTKAGLIICNFR